MKEAILLIGRPTTQEQENIIKDMGNFFSQFGIDVHLMTNYPAAKQTEKEFTGSYYLDYNPRGGTGFVWKVFNKYTHVRIIPNWCLAVSNLYLNGMKILKALNYTHVYAFNYDIEPNFPKIKDYITKCQSEISNGKLAIFTQYPTALQTIDSIPQYDEKTIDNEHFAGNLDFLISIFNNICGNYFDNHKKVSEENIHAACEHHWEFSLRNYKNKVTILPREEALQGLFSVDEEDILVNGDIVHYGYNIITSQAMVYLPVTYPVKFFNDNREIPFTQDNGYFILDINKGEECWISYYINEKEYTLRLFIYNENFKENYYFTNEEF